MALESADREALLSQVQRGPTRPSLKRDPSTPISYNGAHRRIYRARGPASNHRCECGSAAQNWAYDHNDPHELTGTIAGWAVKGKEVRYSADPRHYVPMCRLCHTAWDMGLARDRKIASQDIRDKVNQDRRTA